MAAYRTRTHWWKDAAISIVLGLVGAVLAWGIVLWLAWSWG